MNWLLNSIICLTMLVYMVFELQKLLLQTTHPLSRYYLYVLTVMHYAVAAFFYYQMDFNDTNIDAVRYYQVAIETSNWFSLTAIGHGVISFLIYPFTSIGISLGTLFLVFSTISLKGFYIYMDLIGVSKLQLKSFWLLSLFLLPSGHYWTGFVGKDAIIFLLLVLVLKAVKLKKWDWYLAILLLAVFVIRPHVFFVLLIALVFVNVLDKQLSIQLKKKLMLGVIVAILVLLPIGLLFFMKLQNLSFEALQVSYHEFIAYTENFGATAISLETTNMVERMGYILAMPLPFLYPLTNVMLWASAIENCYVVLALIITFYQIFNGSSTKNFTRSDVKFTLIASAFLWLLFGAYVYNLGLANRMRMVFFPYLVYALLTISSNKTNEKKIN